MIVRVIDKQRSISLYEDQEVRLSKYIEDNKLPSKSVGDIIRKGVDLILAELEGRE